MAQGALGLWLAVFEVNELLHGAPLSAVLFGRPSHLVVDFGENQISKGIPPLTRQASEQPPRRLSDRRSTSPRTATAQTAGSVL